MRKRSRSVAVVHPTDPNRPTLIPEWRFDPKVHTRWDDRDKPKPKPATRSRTRKPKAKSEPDLSENQEPDSADD